MSLLLEEQLGSRKQMFMFRVLLKGGTTGLASLGIGIVTALAKFRQHTGLRPGVLAKTSIE